VSKDFRLALRLALKDLTAGLTAENERIDQHNSIGRFDRAKLKTEFA
jgi:hypothetical protein